VSDRRLRLSVGGLAAVGAAVAGYLTYARYTDAMLVCATGGCEPVQRSEYAVLAGIPVAVLGLLTYLVLLASAFTKSELSRATGAVLAISGALFAAYLLWAQVFLIDAICQWCLASDVLITLLAAACALRLRSR
jgi:uncharacterized membrane protein